MCIKPERRNVHVILSRPPKRLGQQPQRPRRAPQQAQSRSSVTQTWVDLHHNQECHQSITQVQEERLVKPNIIYRQVPIPSSSSISIDHKKSASRSSGAVFNRSHSLESCNSSEVSSSGSSEAGSDPLRRALKRREDMTSFAKVLLHAVKCRSCDSKACQKMRLVLSHFLTCKTPRAEISGCQICSQLMGIVAGNEALRKAIKL